MRNVSSAESGQASPDSSLRTAPQGNPQPPKIPAPYLQVSRFYRSLSLSKHRSPSLSRRGLHGLFVGFRAIHPAVVFFCHTFCNPRTIWHIAFSRSSKKSISQSTHRQKSRLHSNRHHRATLVPEKKTTQSYYT